MRFLQWVMVMVLCMGGAAEALAQKKQQAEPPLIMGWVERVIVQPGGLIMKAKLDTGATTSSIRADVIKKFEKEGEDGSKEGEDGSKEEHILFTIEDKDGNKHTLERKIVRMVRIKMKGNRGYIRRPVVKLGFCVGNHFIEDEVNLSPRQKFLYPVLVGRNMLKKRVLVDSSRRFTHAPRCEQ